MGAALYALVHLVVYGSWRIPANEERVSRRDGKQIPYYATGGIGNALGFTLVAISVGLTHPIPTIFELSVAVLFGVITAAVLNYLWSQEAKKRTVGVYLRSGKPTRAGRIHLLYVVLVSSLVVLLFFSRNELGQTALALSMSGIGIYTVAIAIDRWRGVI